MLESFKKVMDRPDIISQLSGVWVILNDLKDRVKVFDVKNGDKIDIYDDRITQFIKDNLKLINQREYEYRDKQIEENFISSNYNDY